MRSSCIFQAGACRRSAVTGIAWGEDAWQSCAATTMRDSCLETKPTRGGGISLDFQTESSLRLPERGALLQQSTCYATCGQQHW